MKQKLQRMLLLLLILLCGCSRVREKIETVLWEKSGLAGDPDYQQYRNMEAEELLDDDGIYHSEEFDRYLAAAEEQPAGPVRVSFARNDYLHFDYFRDEAMSEPLSAENCRLSPGDSIYASAPVLTNPNSSLYQFSEFQVREYDASGNMKGIAAVSRNVPGLVFRIPDDFSGTELALIPLGEYRNRTVNLSAGYIKPGGERQILENGVWEINGKRYGNVTVELNPMESYRVVYDYSAYKDGWYFAGSSPESYWDKSSEGTITFFAVPSNEEHVDYTVQLHPYGSMKILNGVSYQNAVDSFLDNAAAIFTNKNIIETQNILSLVQVNGITVINNFSDTEVSVTELKAGDEIFIRIPSALKLIASGLQLPPSTLSGEDREYRFLIPDTEEMKFSLSVTEHNTQEGIYHAKIFPGGTLTLYDSTGIAYTDGSEMPAEQEKITVEVVPETGLCIYGKNITDNVYRTVMTYEDFLMQFDEIVSSHPIRPGIVVTLDTEDELGECVFWSDNEMLSGEVMLREGQDLQFDYMLDRDSGLEIIVAPEDRGQPLNVWSVYAANRELYVTEEMNGKTLRCRDFLTFKEGVSSNAAEDHF